MPINIEELKRKHGKDSTPQPKKPKIVKPLIKKEKEIVNEQEIKDKLIKEILEKKIKKGGNMTEKKKKKPVKKVSGGLDRLNRTKENYESITSGISKIDTTQNISDNPIEDIIRRLFREELPRLIKEGRIDTASLFGVDNRTVGTNNDLTTMLEMLNQRYQSNTNVSNTSNPFDQLKQTIELARLLNTPQQKGNDNILLAYLLKQKESNNNVLPILTKLLEMNEKYTNARFDAFMSRLGGGAPSEDPQDKLMKNFQFFRDITGDKRQRTKDEMEFDIKRKELEIQEYARRDMLDREERQQARETEKGARVLDAVSTVFDKVIGNGLGNLVGDLMNAKNGRRRGKGSNIETEDYDASLLDEL